MLVDLSSTGSALSIAGLPIACLIALAHIKLKPRRRGRTRWRTAWRILFPRRIWLHPSTLLDFQYVMVGTFAFSALFSYTLLTGYGVSNGVCEGLTRLFGPRAAPLYLPFYAKAIIVVGLYLIIELAYWLDHFLSHKIAVLWEFHKVHHSATVLTPFANWRVHPVDTIVYMNILSILAGGASGLIQYFVGDAFSLTSTAITTVLWALYMAIWGHLQHSQFWMSCTGLAGRIFLSPAHHQIHHSRNPIHFDKNFGASLAVWDWVFRTLHMPQRHNEHIRFGTERDGHLKSLLPSVFCPFYYAAKRLIAMLPTGNSASEGVSTSPVSNPDPAAAATDMPGQESDRAAEALPYAQLGS